MQCPKCNGLEVEEVGPLDIMGSVDPKKWLAGFYHRFICKTCGNEFRKTS